MVLASIRARVADLEAEAAVLARALRHDRTPRPAKVLVAVVLAFVASPLDPIPDVLPVVGFADELLLVSLGLWAVRRLVPEDVPAECRAEPAAAVEPTRGRWLAAGVVVVGWAVVAALCLRLVVGWP